MDYYNRYVEVVITVSMTAAQATEQFNIMSQQYLFLDYLIMDNGWGFKGTSFSKFVKVLAIQHQPVTRLRAQANREVQ
jgi:hypothetical protein